VWQDIIYEIPLDELFKKREIERAINAHVSCDVLLASPTCLVMNCLHYFATSLWRIVKFFILN